MRYCCWAEMTSFFYLFYIFFSFIQGDGGKLVAYLFI